MPCIVKQNLCKKKNISSWDPQPRIVKMLRKKILMKEFPTKFKKIICKLL